MYAYEADIFTENCRALAEAARARGAQLLKLPEHAVAIEVRGESVAFPIASDERDWMLTTPEEAFYAAMLDAEAFSVATFDDASGLDAAERSARSLLRAEHDDAARRVLSLAALLGGDAAFAGVLRAGGLCVTGSRFRR